jgi:hypothetical protein
MVLGGRRKDNRKKEEAVRDGEREKRRNEKERDRVGTHGAM